MSTIRTSHKQPDTPEANERLETETPQPPVQRVPEHDELLRPNPPFPGDTAD